MKEKVKNLWKRNLLLAALSFCMVFAFGISVKAADTTTLTVKPTYGQTAARSMLTMVNNFRQGSNAWYWNADDITKTNLQGTLSKYTYDYELEKIAMQRAAEIAILWSHTRPDGQDTYSAYTSAFSGSSYMGENIAAGSTTASGAFTQWEEAGDPYSGQGHRRNMLDSGFKYIGIGHVVYNGTHYWVQEFSKIGSGLAQTAAVDSAKSVSVVAKTADISNQKIVASPASLKVQTGKTVSMPTCKTTISFAGHWPSGAALPIDNTLKFTITDTSIATITNGTIKGLKAGKTTLNIEGVGTKVSVTITVGTTSTTGSTTLKPGTKVSNSKATYKVLSNGTLQYTKIKSKKATSATVPSTVKFSGKTYKVTTIAAKAFASNKKLKSVVIGKNVKTIGSKAFYNCKKLKKVTFKGKSVKKIGKSAFKGIYKKAKVKAPKSKVKTYKKLLKKAGLPKTASVKK